MDKNDEPAFPWMGTIHHQVSGPGLTKRELFAAMALQGALANGSHDFASKAVSVFPGAARVCVRFADALLAELAISSTPSQPEGPKGDGG